MQKARVRRRPRRVVLRPIWWWGGASYSSSSVEASVAVDLCRRGGCEWIVGEVDGGVAAS